MVYMSLDAFTMIHVVSPLAFIGLTSDMGELTIAMGTPKIPCSVIARTVSEYHGATSVSETT